MKKVTREQFERMKKWMWINARPLELALWRYLFENGSIDEVVRAISYYQNEDGGFGNAIDADSWNPESTPYSTSHAVRVMRMVGFTDITHPIYTALLGYLEHTPYQNELGWMFTVPSNLDHPHAIWWEYEGERNKLETPGLSGHICGFALRYLPSDHPFFAYAERIAKGLLSLLDSDIEYGDMGVGGYRVLLTDIESAGLTERFAGSERWQLYRDKVGVEKEMFEGVETPLLPEGVWDIPWRWYVDDRYPAEEAISRNWWRARYCIEQLVELDKLGMVER